MAAVEDGAMVVVDEAGCPQGICTNFDLRTRVATGEVPVDAAVREVMHAPVFTIPPGLSVGNSLLEMMRRGARHLCVTEDGTAATRALETLSEHGLMVLYGNNPLTVLRAISSAPDVPTLAALRDRVDGLLRRGLQRPTDVDWYCEVISEIDRALIRRVAGLIRQNHGGTVAVSLLLLGTAGRREKLARTEIGLAAILPDGAECADTRAFFVEITAALERCGFARRTTARGRSPEIPVFSLAAWERIFREVITWPREGDIHSRLALFDFDPLEPGCPLAGRLREVVREAVEGSMEFRAILARDALDHVPPLTFFEGHAVDEKGEPIGVFDINDRAFWAVSDVARALAFERGELEARSTLARLQLGAEAFPAHSGVLKEAARAVRIILYLRARNAFLTGGEGNVFTPDSISLADQAMLKASFRAITKLLDFMRTHSGLA
jgi:CBS domain-containing protein